MISVSRGYRVYYDTEEKQFKYDEFESDAKNYTEGSTETWFNNLKGAAGSATAKNTKLESGELEIKFCRDCHQPFTFYKSEADWFESRKLTPPARCKTCREKRKFEDQYKHSRR